MRLFLLPLLFCATAIFLLRETQVFAQQPLTLCEIAKANDETWASFKTVEMDFAVVEESAEVNGEEGTDTKSMSLQNRWTFDQEQGKERLTRIYDFGEETMLSDSLLDDQSLREHQVTRDENGVLFCGTISPAINPIWQSRVNLSPYLMRYPCGEIDLDTAKTLSWILTNWKSTLGQPVTTEKNEIVWPIHVQCPDELPWAGGTMRIDVNADKGFLVQKVVLTGLDLANGLTERPVRTTVDMYISDFRLLENSKHYFPNGFVCRRLIEPIKEGMSPQSVYKEIVIRSVVNEKLPPDALHFRFERGEIVTEYNSLSDIVAVYLWGENNQPEKTFANYDELESWQWKQDILAFVTDYLQLPHIIGKDIGVGLREVIRSESTRLMLTRQRAEQELRPLTPAPTNAAENIAGSL